LPKEPTPVVPLQTASAQEPTPDTVPQAKSIASDTLEMSYSLPDAEDWVEGDRRAIGFENWTPDSVIRNEKLGAVIVFAGYPANLGSTLDVADGLRAKFATTSMVMAEASGRFASFSFCKKRAKTEPEATCGKVYVVRVPSDRNQYVLIVGTWPESSSEMAEHDLDVAARSFAAKHAQ
jgi:hypothetical protein